MSDYTDFSVFPSGVPNYTCSLERYYPFKRKNLSFSGCMIVVDDLSNLNPELSYCKMTEGELRFSIMKNIAWALLYTVVYHPTKGFADQSMNAFRMAELLTKEFSLEYASFLELRAIALIVDDAFENMC
jgi:hypothetical protein